MANLLLGFPNQVDATFYTVAFSGGSWEASLPLTNLRTPLLAEVARSTDATLASTTFDVDLGISRGIRLSVIPKSNLSRDARIRIRGSETAGDFSSPVYDTGWLEVWTTIYAPESLNWEHPSFWTLQLTDEEVGDYNIAFIHLADAEQTARYWRWEIDDEANADGYVDLSRLFMAPGWQPSRNFAPGAQLGVTTDTTAERSLGGVDYYDRHPARRYARFALRYIEEDEALQNAFEMQRRLGIDRQLFYVFDPADTVHLHRRSFLATMRELSPLEFPLLDYTITAFHVQEVL